MSRWSENAPQAFYLLKSSIKRGWYGGYQCTLERWQRQLTMAGSGLIINISRRLCQQQKTPARCRAGVEQVMFSNYGVCTTRKNICTLFRVGVR
jgi:hypothetical protein